MKQIIYKERDCFRRLILSGSFDDACREHAVNMQCEELNNELLALAFDVQNILVYAFTCHLITKNNCADYHHFAARIMSHPLCFIEDAYDVALYHIKRVLEIAPEDIEAMEMMMFFNTITDKLISDEAAIEIAGTILQKNPQNKTALEYMKGAQLQWKNERTL